MRSLGGRGGRGRAPRADARLRGPKEASQLKGLILVEGLTR